MTYTREQLEHIRKELRMNGKGRKGNLHKYLSAKKEAEAVIQKLKPEPKNYRINSISSIKDILGGL